MPGSDRDRPGLLGRVLEIGERAGLHVRANDEEARARVARLDAEREVADVDAAASRNGHLVRIAGSRPRPVDRLVERDGQTLELRLRDQRRAVANHGAGCRAAVAVQEEPGHDQRGG